MILFIYCAGGLGREILDFAFYLNECQNRWDTFGFVDDITEAEQIHNIPVYRYEEVKRKYSRDEVEFIIASGEPFGRKVLYEKLAKDHMPLTNLIYPLAEITPYSVLGKGIIVLGMTVICSRAVIGDNALIDTATISHDVYVGKNSVVSPRAFIGGGTEIAENAFVGAGALVKDKIKVGAGAIVGMGSVVLRSVKEEKIVLGNPAKVIGVNESHQVFT